MTTVYTVNNKVLKNSATDKWLAKKETPVDPYNPLGLPPNTVRVRTSDGNVPVKISGVTMYESATLVAGTSDVYDVYMSGTSLNEMFRRSTNLVEVLGANTTGITQMNYMFEMCTQLTSIPLFDTSNVTTMERMFQTCNSLTNIPLFNTSNVTNMNRMFEGCYNVQSGALALYQQASSQAVPPQYHSATFFDCGSETVTGAAELEQIPEDWKY